MNKLLNKILIEKRSLTRVLFFLFLDTILISFSVFLAFLLRFEGDIPSQHFLNIKGMMIISLAYCLPIFYSFKLYSFSWMYISTEELFFLVKATTLSFAFLIASIFILRDSPFFIGFPRSTLFISYVLIISFIGGLRISKRIYLKAFKKGLKLEKEITLIVGAGDAGEQILRSILNSNNSPYFPVGFIDDSAGKKGMMIHGLKVIGGISDIPRIVKDKKIEGLIIALPSAGSQAIKNAVETGRIAGLKKIKIIPSFDEVIDGQVSLQSLRSVEVEDLLGREPVVLDQKSISNFVQGKVILITGAAGSIGSELCRQVAKFSPLQLLILDQDETGIFNVSKFLLDKFSKLNLVSLVCDIQDKEKINHIFNQYRPNIVFQAAAYKHVPLMEDQPEEAIKNNIFGTKVIAQASLDNSAEKFIFISTDKAVNPVSVMGATKRIGEMICQDLNQKGLTKFVSVRFGNVLDSRGSVIPTFREQIKRGGPVTITHPEMERFFMTTPEACLLVMQAGAMGRDGEIFVLDMGDPIKIIDLAKELIRLSGLEPDKDIPIVFTNPRPGEKFFEEILTAEEGTVATQNKKIFMAKLKDVDHDKLNSGLEKFKIAANSQNRNMIEQILKDIIPSYSPSKINRK